LIDNATPAQKKAVKLYTQEGVYQKINGRLRRDVPREGEMLKVTNDLDAVISKAKLDKGVIAKRMIAGEFADDFLSKPVGYEFTDKAYTSTTLNGKQFGADYVDAFKRNQEGWSAQDARDAASKGEAAPPPRSTTVALMRVSIPKGSNALYIGKHSADKGFHSELLLPRGSKFRIASVDKTTGEVNVEYLGVAE
jgi:hypothetical protein